MNRSRPGRARSHGQRLMLRRTNADPRVAVWGALLVMPLCAWAQGTPVFTAPLVEPPSAVSAPASREPASPQALVRWFEQACVVTQGQAGAAVDWALSNGFEPVDALRGGADTLLDGKPGTVLMAPDSGGQVMLAATDAQCSLWTEQQEGPPLRAALAAMVGELTAKGGKARVEVERNLERAGAWRGQVQWRFRGLGWSRDVGVGAVTTLANTPARRCCTWCRWPKRSTMPLTACRCVKSPQGFCRSIPIIPLKGGQAGRKNIFRVVGLFMSFIANLKIGTRLSIGFSLVVAGAVCLAVVGLPGSRTSGRPSNC